ncbi:DNA binding protein [Erwinia phage AH06]|nr:DNA binding protein [Erwinia phage AH06]
MLNKEIRIVVASVKGFTDAERLKMTIDEFLDDIYYLNEGIGEDDEELITDAKIVFITNGEHRTAAELLRTALGDRDIDIEEIRVDWSKGKKAFYDNCAVLGAKSTHGIIFTDHKDEGMQTLLKACLDAGSRVRSYSSAI